MLFPVLTYFAVAPVPLHHVAAPLESGCP